MLDLSRDDFRLHQTSGPAQVITIHPEHVPILEQGSRRRVNNQAADVGQQYVKYSRFRGRHLVLDLNVPPKLYNSIAPVQSGLQQRYQVAYRNEFSHVRYTPVVCDPFDFVQDGYLLQQQLFVKPRPIEICVGITMYNEDEWLLGKTLEAIHSNIKGLQDPSRPSPWGADSWQKIVVCIISDGRNKINEKTKAMLASLGVYQDVGMMQAVDGKDVTMHLFEYTTHSSIRFNRFQVSVEIDTPDAVPCQTVFCLKEKNQKKINSHRWFLGAICNAINPRICVMLDAGTIPQADALYHLWKPLHENETVAATTGFCHVRTSSPLQSVFNPSVGFQVFEYRLNNYLQRPVESVFGRRFALNIGSFAAYRWSIVAPNNNGAFEDYFSGERLPTSTNAVSKANSFLVEDRAISSSLLRTDLKAWRTVAVDSAEVVVDVPDNFAELCLQRRRWLNGDFYSTMHELRHTFSYIRLGAGLSSIPRIFGLLAGVVYQIVTVFLQFFAVGNLFAVFCVVTTSLSSEVYLGKNGQWAALATSYMYLCFFLAGVICSMGNRVQFNKIYIWLSLLWILLYCYFVAIVLHLIIRGSRAILNLSQQSTSTLLTGQLFMLLVWPLIITMGIWLIAPLTLLRKPHSISACIWYSLFLPVYTNLISTYAWCNVHDISWGTKGESLPTLRTLGRGGVNISTVNTEIDPQTGDLILHGYSDYLNELDNLFESQRRACEEKTPQAVQAGNALGRQEEYFRMYRTVTLLYWLGLNSALVMVVVNVPSISRFTPTADGGNGLVFVGVVLWAYAGVAGFQYCCTVLYALSKLWSLISSRVLGVGKSRRLRKEKEEVDDKAV